MLIFNEFSDFTQLSQTRAVSWLDLIRNTPADQPCTFALAGGTTPGPLYREFDALFAEAKPRPVQFISTDERWVLDEDAQSNQRLFHRCFSSSANFWSLVSLKNDQSAPTTAVPAINTRIALYCNHPFSAVILGMGTDGHIASLFPHAPELLKDDTTTDCVAAYHPLSQQQRISLSMSRLLKTNKVWLVITGAEKRAVLEKAASDLASIASPIGAFLAAARCDVEVFWCP